MKPIDGWLEQLSPRSLLLAMLFIISVLVVMGLGVKLGGVVAGLDVRPGVVALFDLNHEGNVPVWFSSTGLAVASLLAFLCRIVAPEGRWRWHWLGIALLLIAASLDETASFHERLGRFIRRTFDTTGVAHFGWVLPAIAMVIFLLGAYLRFLIAQPKVIRSRMIIAAVLYVGGAVGMEMVSGWFLTSGIEEQALETTTYVILATIEETLEMCGIAVGITAILMRLQYDLAASEEPPAPRAA